VGLSYYFWYNPIFFESRTPQRFFWLSAMFTADSMQVLQDHPDKIDMLSPTWYTLQANGSIYCERASSNGTLQEMEDMLQFCDTHDISVHPLVACSNVTIMRALLETTANQQNFFSSLDIAFDRFAYAGINIDFEGIPDDLRDEFTIFFVNLATQLNDSRVLSIDVPAMTGDTTSGWAGWCDYRALGGIADMVMIMTYDAHGGWTEAGEVAPTSWVRDVMAYATRSIPRAKIYAGIPFYGYDWSTDPAWQNWGFGFSFFEARKALHGGSSTRTGDGREIRLEYIDGSGFSHVCYYCDVETTLAKESFLSRYPIGGYCYWHLSCGDPAFFGR
jgi:spore germination protein